MSRPRRWSAAEIAADEARWRDHARWQQAADDAAHTGRLDPEWSTEQTHTGEFGDEYRFGEERDD
jgi:hypothetical protein